MQILFRSWIKYDPFLICHFEVTLCWVLRETENAFGTLQMIIYFFELYCFINQPNHIILSELIVFILKVHLGLYIVYKTLL